MVSFRLETVHRRYLMLLTFVFAFCLALSVFVGILGPDPYKQHPTGTGGQQAFFPHNISRDMQATHSIQGLTSGCAKGQWWFYIRLHGLTQQEERPVGFEVNVTVRKWTNSLNTSTFTVPRALKYQVSASREGVLVVVEAVSLSLPSISSAVHCSSAIAGHP